MKNSLAILFSFLLLSGGGAAFAGTNEITFAASYEKLTDDVINIFREDCDFLRSMQTQDRAMETKLWLQLLNQIGKTRDLNFDFKAPENRYYANVAPPFDPSNSTNVMYDSGISPEAIKEPDTRKAYEYLILKNHEKALRFGFELKLKKIDGDAMESALRYFNLTYAKTPADARELIGCLSVLADANRRAKMEEQLHEFVELAKKQ